MAIKLPLAVDRRGWPILLLWTRNHLQCSFFVQAGAQQQFSWDFGIICIVAPHGVQTNECGDVSVTVV